MPLLAEVIVEDWLNRQGYFTIRGVKLANDEIDLLAVRPNPDGSLERRHIEVSVSTNPISYFSPLPKSLRKAGGTPTSAKRRSPRLLAESVQEWVYKKFLKPNKALLFEVLGGGTWSREFVIYRAKYPEEIDLIRSHNVRILRLPEIVKELRSGKLPIKAASGSDLLELMIIATADDDAVAEAVDIVTDTE